MEQIPDGLVCLTFDDAVRSQYEFATPILEELGFGATFYISEGLRFLEDKSRYLEWEEIADLHTRGFEIGNHTRAHTAVSKQTDSELRADIDYIDAKCEEHGIPLPTTFCYPGYATSDKALGVLQERGFEFARRGSAPEMPYNREGGRGPAYDPSQHDPLLVPTTGAAGPDYTFDVFRWSVDQAKDGRVCVFTLHGTPDLDHPWVNTDPDVFESYVRHLKDNGCTVISLAELNRYVQQ